MTARSGHAFLFSMLMVAFCIKHYVVTQEYDVIIIGAGMTGLGAGKYLSDKSPNTNFIIFEAQNYIGGRVKTTNFSDETVGLGAGWIHGADKDNVLYQLANKYNLKRYQDDYTLNNTMYRYPNGSQIPDKVMEPRLKQFYNAVERGIELVDKKVEEDGVDISAEASLRWAGFSQKDVIDTAITYFHYDFENSQPPSLLATFSSGITGEGRDEIVTDRKGYLYPVLQETKSFHDKISLNSPVAKVQRFTNNTFSVMLANGTSYTAKFVIVTASVGVLQEKGIEFFPALPAWKIEAMSLIAMGHYCKIFLKFSEKFWPSDKGYVIIASHFRGQYVHWQNLDKVGLFNGKAILMATLTGQICKDSHYKSDQEIMDDVYQNLRKVYPNATKPIEMVRNDWSTNPYVRGAYSYQPPGVNENTYRALEHPVQQRLFFVGEYTGRWYFGYAHIPYGLGMEAAKNVTICMNDGICATDSPVFESRAPKCNSNSSRTVGVSMILYLFTFIISGCFH